MMGWIVSGWWMRRANIAKRLTTITSINSSRLAQFPKSAAYMVVDDRLLLAEAGVSAFFAGLSSISNS
jgi:hypothetical protein